jgi:predicted phosphoadenosine phosphosulfate sulfurtransferase
MSIRIDNLSKPSNKNWKQVSNALLYTLPLYLTTIMSIPISEGLKLWLNFGMTILIITLKGFSKFTSEEEV